MANNTAPANSTPISVDYTSRDYYSLRNELITRMQARIPEWQGSDPSDFGVALVEAFAYMGDIINYYIDRAANEAYLSTATQRQSLVNLAKSYGYIPTGYVAATVELTFTNTGSESVTLPAGTQVMGEVLVNGALQQVIFTTNDDVIIPASGTSTVEATHGEQVAYRTENLPNYSGDIAGEILGYSTGIANQALVLSENQVVEDSIKVFVRSGSNSYQEWKKVTSLSEYGPNAAVFTTEIDENNYTSVVFGDGISGAIPPMNSAIKSQYLVGGGTIGNISAGVIDSLYSVPDMTSSEVTSLSATVTPANLESAFGGTDPESLDSIRVNAPKALTALTRAVSTADFANLTLAVAGVSKASAVADTPNSVTVYFSVFPADTQEQFPSYDDNPAGGGVVTAQWETVRDRVDSYLSDKSLIGTTVTIAPPTYVPVSLDIEYTVLPQFSSVDMVSKIKTALINTYNFNNLNFGDIITPEDIEYTLRKIDGIVSIKVVNLYRSSASASRSVLIAGPSEMFVFIDSETTITLRSSEAKLSALSAASGTLSPAFTSTHYSYSLVGCSTDTTVFTPTASVSGATVTVNGASPTTAASTPNSAISTVKVVVTAPDQYTQQTYTITVDRT